MTRTKSSLLVACLLLVVGGGCQSAEPDRPNVVLIYADDLGYGDLSAYGATQIHTPHLDTLAHRGLRLTHAYATAATCTPSRYSLLTGRYAFRKEGASILPGDAGLVIDTSRTTLASMLNDTGYATGIIGKWHLGLGRDSVNWNERIAPGPLELGFDRSFIVPATNDRVPTVFVKGHHVYNLSESDPPLRVRYDEKIGDHPTGDDHPEELRYPADAQHSGTIVNGISRIGWMAGGQSARWSDADMAHTLTRRAQAFIEGAQHRPFLLFLPLLDVHVPRWPAEQFRGTSGTGLRGDAIKEIDWVVGQIRATLRRLNLAENTLVLFTSDNGPVYDDGYDDGAVADANGHVANGPLRGGKYQSFEGGSRVPFIVHWPGHIEANAPSDALFSQVDLLATLAEVTGAPLPNDAGPDSVPLPGVLRGTTEQGRAHLVQQGVRKLALRRGDWKYIPPGPYPDWPFAKHNDPESPIATPIPPPEQALLYNLADDPDESDNVIEQHPDIAQKMAALLDTLRKRPNPARQAPTP